MRAGAERSGRVGDLDRITLGIEEFDEPAAHFSGAADDECAAAGALPLRRHLRLFLCRERAPDQEAQQAVGERGRQPELCGSGARIQEHFALALKVPRRVAGRALCARNFLGKTLALGDEREQVSVEFRQPLAQPGEIHAYVSGKGPRPVYRPACRRASGPLSQSSAFDAKTEEPAVARIVGPVVRAVAASVIQGGVAPACFVAGSVSVSDAISVERIAPPVAVVATMAQPVTPGEFVA